MPSASTVNLSNGAPISFVVRRSKQSKRITLRLYADGVLRVAAPPRASDKAIATEIVRCSDWIVSALQRIPKPTEVAAYSYANGSEHLYLGDVFVLRWASSPVASRLNSGELTVHAEDENSAALAVQSWYRAQADLLFRQRVTFWAEKAPWVSAPPPLSIKKMTSRWGSCSAKGRVNLNVHLIKAPKLVLDEVVVHELCHLKEMNHGPRFYKLLDDMLPQWQQSRLWLKKNSQALIADHNLWH